MPRTSLTRTLVAAMLGLAALAAVSVGLEARRGLALVNRTALTIDEVFLAPAGSGSWGDDRLEGDTLASNGRGSLSFTADTSSCRWDLKIVDTDDAEAVFPNLNLCGATEVTVSFDGGQPNAQVR